MCLLASYLSLIFSQKTIEGTESFESGADRGNGKNDKFGERVKNGRGHRNGLIFSPIPVLNQLFILLLTVLEKWGGGVGGGGNGFDLP